MDRLVAALCCLVGCDPAICQPDPFVAIATSEVSLDTNPTATGIQATIRVHVSIPKEMVTLEVFDASGELLGTSHATVDDDGLAEFDDVILSTPTSRLVASVEGECGSGFDELTIPVSASGCVLRFDPVPEASSFYAPFGVLNTLSDRDATLPGLQAGIIVNTIPHATVEILDDTGTGDRSFAVFDAGESGLVDATRTLDDGPHSFRAVCTVDLEGKISEPIPVVVDSLAPACEFTTPAPGTTIRPSMDADLDISNGIQLLVSAQVPDDDVIDEPTTLVVTEAGGAAVPFITTPVDADGTAGGSATLDPITTPATFSFVFGVRDHAHNPCTVTTQFIVTD